jgi:hypothetical protein
MTTEQEKVYQLKRIANYLEIYLAKQGYLTLKEDDSL